MNANHNTSPNGIITLMTDFGVVDEYVGVMKGVILKYFLGATIVDITHAIPPQEILQASLMLQSSFPYFKEGTTHLVVVDPGVGSQRELLLLEADKQYFIGPDNGVLSPALLSPNLQGCYQLLTPAEPASNTFHGRDIMAPAAAQVAAGEDIENLARPISPEKCVTFSLPEVKEISGGVMGTITTIDHFGNIITSIDASIIPGPHDQIITIIGSASIKELKQTYAHVQRGEPLVLINSRGKLEIAINQGNASEFFDVALGDSVEVLVENKDL